MKQQEEQETFLRQKLVLQLYVSGMSQKSMEAIKNIRQLCTVHLEDEAYDLSIIDIYKHPEIAHEQQIVFSPCLIKKLPEPRKILIGDLSNAEKVIKALGITFKE